MSLTFRFIFLMAVQLLLLVRCTQTSQEEIVAISDQGFLRALMELGVDKNGDGLISYQEAEATVTIRLHPSDIRDLGGLEAFVNLDSLMIHMNPVATLNPSYNTSLRYLSCTGCELEKLDVSNNNQLTYLDCSGGAALSNSLSHLDLSKNSKLEILNCSENRLTSLNLSANQYLREVNCGRNLIEALDVTVNKSLTKLLVSNNLFTELDVSQNSSLTKLITCGNRITDLDVSVNADLVVLGVDNMTTIYEVCVWTTPFPPPGVTVLSEYSPNVFFTTSCQEKK